MKKDVQRLRLQGTEKRLAAMYGVQQADLTGRMTKSIQTRVLYYSRKIIVSAKPNFMER